MIISGDCSEREARVAYNKLKEKVGETHANSEAPQVLGDTKRPCEHGSTESNSKSVQP